MTYRACFSFLIGTVLAFSIAGCAGGKAVSKVKKGEISKTIDTPTVETDRYIEFDGIGAADQTIENMSQKRSLSESAGRKIAEEKMLAYLKGQQIDATTTVEQAITTDQRIQGVVSNTLRGAAVVKREWTSDDGCVVTIRLDKKKFIDQVKEIRGK
ncbi:MAG: hypothetical protein HYT97_03745 [Elusimicrobia bacterium]|nr:hypothetical protein [Elusimicrobiota bacterium]